MFYNSVARSFLAPCKLRNAGVVCCNFTNQLISILNLTRQRSTSTKTFSLDDQLPNLKVPSLENTIEKYLDSVKAVATDEEYESTQQICSRFLHGEGKKLQSILVKMKKDERNWITEWWDGKRFLGSKDSLYYLNFCMMLTNQTDYWQIKEGTRAERMGFGMHVLALFWKLLREEKMEPHKTSDGSILSMHQFRKMFNTTRIPRQSQDKLVSYFKTESEGYTPSHTVVICKGYFFKVELMNKEGEPFTPPQLQKALLEIEEICQYRTISAGVAALTALDRETWAVARQNLLDIDPVNKHSLHDIDSAIGVATMDDSSPRTYSEISKSAFCGDPTLKWLDKSHNSIWFKNGTFTTTNEHSGGDALGVSIFLCYCSEFFLKNNGNWSDSTCTDNYPKPKEIEFIVDNRIVKAISEGKNTVKKLDNDLTVLHYKFIKFGKLELKKFKVHADAFLQICIQLAYMRLHEKPGTINKTSTLRKYYHGRIETCRACTPELVRFCQAVIDGDSNAIALLRPAHDKFITQMRECQNNKGCDRHLYGLYIVAQNEGICTSLFQDPMYKKAGNLFDIITSSTECVGGGVPMLEDGYGAFFSIYDSQIHFVITKWNYSKVSDAHKLKKMLDKSFVDVMDMFKKSFTSN